MNNGKQALIKQLETTTDPKLKEALEKKIKSLDKPVKK